jgi:hypothetical protein
MYATDCNPYPAPNPCCNNSRYSGNVSSLRHELVTATSHTDHNCALSVGELSFMTWLSYRAMIVPTCCASSLGAPGPPISPRLRRAERAVDTALRSASPTALPPCT